MPHNTQIKCQSTGRGMGHPWAALGSHRPRELQPGAHAGTNASVGKWPSPCAAPWGDKGSLCGSMSPWGLWQCCHGAGRGSSRAQGPAGRMGNTRDSAEKTSAGPRSEPQPRGGTRAAARSRPRGNRCHRPSPGISQPCQGVLRNLQVAEATSCPGSASLHPTGYFSLEWEARPRSGCWAPSEQGRVLGCRNGVGKVGVGTDLEQEPLMPWH